MSLNVPRSQIDSTDERIKQILCLGCRQLLYVEKGSDCDVYGRCTACCMQVDNFIQRTRNDS